MNFSATFSMNIPDRAIHMAIQGTEFFVVLFLNTQIWNPQSE